MSAGDGTLSNAFQLSRKERSSVVQSSERDGESGEVVTQRICVLRKPPERCQAKCKRKSRPHIPYYFHRHTAYSRSRPFLRESCCSGRLRMQHRVVGEYLRSQRENLYVHPSASRRQVEMDPFSYLCWHDYSERSVFRVPNDRFQENHRKNAENHQEPQLINIWEEFIHGTSVINKSYYRNAQERDKCLASALQSYFSRFLSQRIVNTIIYMVYFIIFVISMFLYNMFWSCLCYILLDGHIRIHEMAYKSNVNLVFGGSIFQGPAYVVVRHWCDHCQQLERERMSIRLMRKMRQDILKERHCNK